MTLDTRAFLSLSPCFIYALGACSKIQRCRVCLLIDKLLLCGVMMQVYLCARLSLKLPLWDLAFLASYSPWEQKETGLLKRPGWDH